MKKPEELAVNESDIEEAIAFDQVMRQLLKAKPQKKPAAKKVAKKASKKAGS